VFISACHKPKDEAPDDMEYVVSEIKYENSPKVEQFSYNGAWQLIEKTERVEMEPKKVETIKHNYTYNSDGLVSKEEISQEMATYVYVGLREMSYDTNGRLVSITEYAKGTNRLLYSSEFEYNDKIIIGKFYSNSILMRTWTYTLDDNGNIIKAVAHSPGGGPDEVQEWLDYDDKQNLLGPVAGNVRSKNNYRRHIMYGGIEGGKNEIVTFYSYKNNKYVSRLINIGMGSSGKATVTWVAKQ